AYIVSEGHIIAEGEPSLILQNQKVRDVYLGQQFQM
ncbi:MAG TPA: lipopolysaccharide ABC transporter ATP-binding protein, partial [Candidatus Kapabacteria bacterium]|nr:lipopolysaccharide ABC transporter ATP-binding protein [Candidatus Kapabacteria bacterium]